MKALEYLKSINLIEKDKTKFLIKFDDGREFELVKILNDFYNKQNEKN